MSDDGNANSNKRPEDGATAPAAPDGSTLTRRKLAYVAPALVSRAMFYGAAGCGKGNPRVLSCIVLKRGSS